MAFPGTSEEFREVRFRCIELAITACRDRIGSATPTDTDVLATAKKFEQYVLEDAEHK